MSYCKECSLEHMTDRIAALEAENLHLRMYAPARRATQNAEPVKAIGPCNTAYWFGLQLADEHFEESGRPYTEVKDEA